MGFLSYAWLSEDILNHTPKSSLNTHSFSSLCSILNSSLFFVTALDDLIEGNEKVYLRNGKREKIPHITLKSTFSPDVEKVSFLINNTISQRMKIFNEKYAIQDSIFDVAMSNLCKYVQYFDHGYSITKENYGYKTNYIIPLSTEVSRVAKNILKERF